MRLSKRYRVRGTPVNLHLSSGDIALLDAAIAKGLHAGIESLDELTLKWFPSHIVVEHHPGGETAWVHSFSKVSIRETCMSFHEAPTVKGHMAVLLELRGRDPR